MNKKLESETKKIMEFKGKEMGYLQQVLDLNSKNKDLQTKLQNQISQAASPLKKGKDKKKNEEKKKKK